MPVLILASSSPYRQQLLTRLGLNFMVISPDINEDSLPGESAEQLVARLSERKAKATANACRHKHPSALVIGSDQVACLTDQARQPRQSPPTTAGLQRPGRRVLYRPLPAQLPNRTMPNLH